MPAPILHIASAGESSIPALVEMMRHYWELEQIRGFDPQEAERMLHQFFAHPDFGHGWIAFNDDTVLGYLLCSCVFSFEYRGLTAAIDELYVIADARGRGVGRALVQAAELHMRARGCVHIEMEVAEGNFNAQQFYSLLGFASKTGYAMMHKRL